MKNFQNNFWKMLWLFLQWEKHLKGDTTKSKEKHNSVFQCFPLPFLKPNSSHVNHFVYLPSGCWAVSQTLRSWVPQVFSPPMLSLSRGCWRTRLPLEAAQETASVPHSNTAANSSSTCTRWPPTRLTGQRITETPELNSDLFNVRDYVLQIMNSTMFLM